MAKTYYPVSGATVMTVAGAVTTGGLSDSGKTADEKAALDKLVDQGVLRTDQPGGGKGDEDVFVINTELTAIGTAQSKTKVVPEDGTLTSIEGVSAGANGTANSVVTITNVTKSNAVMGTLTFSSSYSANTKLTQLTIGNPAADRGDIITIATDGGGDGAAMADIILTFKKR